LVDIGVMATSNLSAGATDLLARRVSRDIQLGVGVDLAAASHHQRSPCASQGVARSLPSMRPGQGERNRLVNGLRFHPARVDVEWTRLGVGVGEPLAEVDVRSFSVPASSSVSMIARAAQAAAIAAAWRR
jgi:hypothetical protein